MSLVALCNNLDYFRKATTDTGISLIASDLIISCRTKKVKQYGGCAEFCDPFLLKNRIFCLDLLFLLRSEGNVYEAIFQRRYLFYKKICGFRR